MGHGGKRGNDDGDNKIAGAVLAAAAVIVAVVATVDDVAVNCSCW